ncbi:MAG: VTT domain-containing protein, partial [Gallionellaceae bacterium]|nr:VTT domain-containing protein [Gallionellaceae bacterium]
KPGQGAGMNSPYLRLLAVLLFLGLLLAVFEATGLRDHFSIELLHQAILDNRIGGLVVFILAFALGNLIQIPGWLFLAAAVLALGRTWGGLATYAAASISCLISFLLVRLLGGDALRQLDNRVARAIFARLDRRPIGSILLMRMLFQTLPALNYALALSGVRLRAYLLGTLLGLPLPIALYCLFFDYLAQALHLS